MPLFGDHTVSETLDFIRAKDLELQRLHAARDKAPRAPDATWDNDFDQLQRDWTSARTSAKAEIATARLVPLVSDNVLTSEAGYQQLLRAITHDPSFFSTDVQGVTRPGGLQDLWNRLTPVTGTIPDDRKSLQPNAPDPDLQAYQAADTAIKKGEKAAKAALSTTSLVAIGVGALAATYVFAKLT